MKAASSNDRTDFILYDAIQGARSHPVCFVEYLNDSGAWVELEDLTGCTVSKDSQDRRYGSFSLLPATTQVSMSINNHAEKYSPGKGGLFDGALIRNRPIRVWMGYNLQEAVSKTLSLNVTTYQHQLYHTQIIGNSVYNSAVNSGGSAALTGITFLEYGDILYGGAVYQYEGYYLTDPIDTRTNPTEILQTLSVTSDTNKIRVYYRTANSTTGLALESFAFVAVTANGTSTINFPDSTKRYIQFAFVWGTGTWSSTSGYITGLVLNYTDTAEYFQQGEFLLDDPTFSSSFGKAEVSVSARDYLKRAYETEVSMPAISGQDVSQILRWACDRAAIPYTSTTLPLVGYAVSVAAGNNWKSTKARDVLDECLSYLAGYVDSNYRLKINDDGDLELFLKPDTATSADWVADYRTSLLGMTKGYSANNLLQRITVLSADQTTDEETTLGSATYTSTGAKTISWAGGAHYTRLDLEWNATSGGYITIQHVNPTSIEFTVFGTDVDVDVVVYGCKESGSAYYGEALSASNHCITSAGQIDTGMQIRNGFTHKLTNRLIGTNAIALAIAENLIDEFGARLFELTCDIPGHPMLEVSDKVMVFEKYTNSSTIFVANAISLAFSANGASFKTSLKLIDYGFTLQSLIYDLNGLAEGAGDLDHDVGYLYDQDLGYVASDTTDYTSLKEVQFT